MTRNNCPTQNRLHVLGFGFFVCIYMHTHDHGQDIFALFQYFLVFFFQHFLFVIIIVTVVAVVVSSQREVECDTKVLFGAEHFTVSNFLHID